MNLQNMLQTWVHVLTHPDEKVFEEQRQKPEATLGTAILWMIIAAVIVAIVSFLAGGGVIQSMGNLQEMLQQADVPPEMRDQISFIFSSQMMTVFLGVASALNVIFVPLMFLITVGIWHLVAVVLGGRSSFGNYAYLIAAFYAPATIVSALLGLIPFVGFCFQPIIFVYELVLATIATKVAYGLTTGKAIVVVLVPFLLILGIVICAFLVIFGLAISAGNVQ